MNISELVKPNYIFETSWEVCNKIGGIHTVVSTKAPGIQHEYLDNFILIGPDVWKDPSPHPEFVEEKNLFRAWREKAFKEGLKIKIGRWRIKGEPIVILVDFTPFIPLKDKIFAEFWETYKLDSISGSWDYIEPTLFGYAAGKVIESFYNFNLSANDKIVAQFHEWMTAAGVLYTRHHVPQVGCVFTTHATVLGRSIAGNNLPLYGQLKNYIPGEIARRFNIVAKHSIEQTAAQSCDAFTTVSEITGNECVQFLGRSVNIVTPNGLDEDLFLTPVELEKARLEARKSLLGTARALLNQNLPDDSLLIINSGRYEFRNKGIDLYIDALGKLNQDHSFERNVVAFITVPAHHSGPVNALLDRLNNPDFDHPISQEYLTHGLFDADYDVILRRIRENSLMNSVTDNVKIIFVPSYLLGDDGVFNKSYYELLPGFDLSIFPSYYEPWGYTPLESIAFGVPTITTSLAGFGVWMRSVSSSRSVTVIERTDDNAQQVIEEIVLSIENLSKLPETDFHKLREEGVKLAKTTEWNNFGKYYEKANKIALEKVESRASLFQDKRQAEEAYYLTNGKRVSHPVWHKILIRHKFPKSLEGLQELTENMWWAWHCEALELFQSIDPIMWEKYEHNPMALLSSLSLNQLKELEKDRKFVEKLKEVLQNFKTYMQVEKPEGTPKIAYFSMEFGLHESLQTYSGGLGILAGDYLKQASDSNIDMIAIGLLYRYGYFKQSLSPSGEQVVQYNQQRFNQLPIQPVRDEDGEWTKIAITLPGRNLYAKVWKIDVGRIPWYLFDTDIEENQPQDRFITHQLYGGDIENRFKQEFLLGVGGIRMLKALNIQPDLYHCNEGHAAFIGIERLSHFVQDQKFSFLQAIELVRASTLFTTHTPVPAGHDSFTEDLLRTYIPHYAAHLNITWNDFMNLGRYNENKIDEKFSMTVLAIKLSQEVNGVSRIHGKVSRQMFRKMYKGIFENEMQIGYVTNGVHFQTWTSRLWIQLYKKEFGEEFMEDQSNTVYWEKIHQVKSEKIWSIRQTLRSRLINDIREHLHSEMASRQENPKNIFKTIEAIDENALTIGFARRFATYKRAHLLFNSIERLEQILNTPGKPIQFVFAGKAHPADKAGADLIKRIIEVSRMPQFTGKIIFLENYNMDIAKKLVQGVDIWLNTPTRPLEASGTSGEKATMNGVINLSVLDGWWAEGYRKDAGWALKESVTYENNQFQDELDAETIYNILEDEIIPIFYDRGESGIPEKWLGYVRNTIAGIAPHFTMKRQLDDYIRQYYRPQYERIKALSKNDYSLMRKLANWKRNVIRNWDLIKVEDILLPDPNKDELNLGERFQVELLINLGDLNPEDIRVEMIVGRRVDDEIEVPEIIRLLKFDRSNGELAIYRLETVTTLAGVWDITFRITPHHPALPHRTDFNLVKWA